MRHNDDAFTAMLLTLPLTANKDELVRPLSSAEFSILRARVAACGARRIGDLIGLDVSGIMNLLKVPEAEAYRLCMLLCRTMPLSYAMERFYEQNLELLTLYDSAYPENLATRLGDDAPAAMYMCGDASILSMPLVGILGISGVRMSKKAEDGLRTLVRALVREGFGIVTSSELGACRLAEAEAVQCGGKVVCALAGDLMAKKDEEDSAAAIARRQMLLLSLVHPDAPYTGVHALARNRTGVVRDHHRRQARRNRSAAPPPVRLAVRVRRTRARGQPRDHRPRRHACARRFADGHSEIRPLVAARQRGAAELSVNAQTGIYD